MFNHIKEYFLSLIKTRTIYLLIIFVALSFVLIHRVFTLQIIHGDDYLNNFQLQIKKQRVIAAPRGNIYDCNGELLAYNELAYSVKIEDVYESGKTKNEKLNQTISRTIDIIEKYNDEIDFEFGISVDNYNNFVFDYSGTKLSRFKADIYGCAYIADMSYLQSSSTATEVMDYLMGTSRYNVNTDVYSKEKCVKIVAIRYAMSQNAYQKYIATTIASNVSEETVAVLMENFDTLLGVSIAEDTIRVYPKGVYTSQIIGYTGRIDATELETLQAIDATYSANDIVGKTGIEASQELSLKGTKGSETVYVDTMGRVIESVDLKESVAGNDLYLTIDSKLQEDVYHILEQKLAGIILKKLTNEKEYIPKEGASSSDILIPIYDVYYQMFNNEVIDFNHLSADDASESEQAAYNAFSVKKQDVLETLQKELTEKKTPYKKLSTEYKYYMNFIEDLLVNKALLQSSLIDYEDNTYKAWAVDETISLAEYIEYAISRNWIDTGLLKLEGIYSDSAEIYKAIMDIVWADLDENRAFDKLVIKYVIKNDKISPRTVCNILLDQHCISIAKDDEEAWQKGRITPFEFMRTRIENLEITPAQLALDPYSASMVITDVNTGDVLALVSYPSYDNNYLANGADANYLKKLNNDLSTPMINYATQQRTAPGSTFKMVSSVAGLCENVVNINTLITCKGSFEEITDVHNCWVYPGRHGALNLTNALRVSCNYYYYTIGYKLSLDNNGKYNSNLGIEKLAQYAGWFGLDEKSGVEIEEYSPQVSNNYSVPSAIGQGTNSFTTVGLARYVTAVANSGTVYNLTLLDKLCDHNGNLIREYSASVLNEVELDDTYWNAIHDGMRRVVEDKYYFRDLPIKFAGKTGTAQQSRNRADHGLFVCYAPYEKPEIAIAVRIANGYSSDYVADTTKDVLKYYFNIEDKEDIVNGSAAEITASGHGGD